VKRINLYEAKTHLSRLISTVEDSGEPIILCRNGRPVADIVPHRNRGITVDPDNSLAGAQYSVDPCAQLPESDWPKELR
jgi:prevent-host-death family protein